MFCFFQLWNSRSKCSSITYPSSLLKFGWNPHSQQLSFPEPVLFPLWRDWQVVRKSCWPSTLWEVSTATDFAIFFSPNGLCLHLLHVCVWTEEKGLCGFPCARKHRFSQWTRAFVEAKPGIKTMSMFFKSTLFWRTCNTNLWLHWEEKNLGQGRRGGEGSIMFLESYF